MVSFEESSAGAQTPTKGEEGVWIGVEVGIGVAVGVEVEVGVEDDETTRV